MVVWPYVEDIDEMYPYGTDYWKRKVLKFTLERYIEILERLKKTPHPRGKLREDDKAYLKGLCNSKLFNMNISDDGINENLVRELEGRVEGDLAKLMMELKPKSEKEMFLASLDEEVAKLEYLDKMEDFKREKETWI